VTLPRLGSAVLLNDLLLIPLLLGVGALTTLLPVRLRPPIRAALIVTGVFLVLAVWATVGQRRSVQPGNTHILPNNYVVSVLLILGPVWALAVASASGRCSRVEVREAESVATPLRPARSGGGSPGCWEHRLASLPELIPGG
jgi:uncharacterized membrane protein (DUF4010 family)